MLLLQQFVKKNSNLFSFFRQSFFWETKKNQVKYNMTLPDRKELNIQFAAKEVSDCKDKVKLLTSEPRNLPLTKLVTLTLTIERETGPFSAGKSEQYKFKYTLSNISNQTKTISYSLELHSDVILTKKAILKSTVSNLEIPAFSCVHKETSVFDLTSYVSDQSDVVLWFEETVNGELGEGAAALGSLTESMKKIFLEDEFKDVKFLINGESVMAHKAIVFVKCRALRAKYELKENKDEVEIDECEMPIFKSFLHYLYTDTIENIQENAEKLIALADKFDMQGLKIKCEQHLCQTINKKNAISYLVKADVYNCKILKSKTLNCIEQNIREIWESQDLLYLRGYPSSCLLYEEIIGALVESLERKSAPPKIVPGLPPRPGRKGLDYFLH